MTRGAHFYRAKSLQGFLGGGYRHFVEMNGHTLVSQCETALEASREAARLNYKDNCYSPTGPIGLDGIV